MREPNTSESKKHPKAETHSYFYLNLNNDTKRKLQAEAKEEESTLTSLINRVLKDHVNNL